MLIKKKYPLLFSAFIFILLFASAWYFYKYLSSVKEEKINQVMLSESEAIELLLNSTSPIDLSSSGIISRITGLNNGYLIILTDTGYTELPHSLHDYADTLELNVIETGSLQKIYSSDGTTWLIKRIPIPGKLSVIGIKKLFYLNNYNSVRAELNSIKYLLIFSCILILLCVYVFTRFFMNIISDSITKTVESIKHIEQGEEIALSLKGNDELSQIEKSLNSLSKKISDEYKKMSKLEKVRSEFLGNVSHELRTPIFSIQGYIETLKNGAITEPGTNMDFLGRIERHAERLNSLVSDLIEISKIESGELKLSYRFFDIQEFLHSIIDELNSLAKANSITINFNSTTVHQILVFADREKIRQVMINLIENAIKYNKSNGSITIELTDKAKEVIISVIDTGIGIPEEHHSRIFERFYRVDKNRSREKGGTGLGLAIAKHIIEAHKGTISISSKVGEGSRFSFPLPKKAL